ncbi:Bax1-I family protein YbhL [Desulfovibrionales bacterium]
MPYGYQSVRMPRARVQVLNTYLRGVYQWMSFGLLLTAALAWVTASSSAMLDLLYNRATGSVSILFWGLVIGELLLVMAISAGITRLSAGVATGLFLLYSGINGVILSSIFLIYTMGSIVQAFMTCAAMFGAMSIYGLITKRDLTGWGSFLFMGLIGIVIASMVNIFLHSSAMNWIVSWVSVVVFTGLTAYDTQKLSNMGKTMPIGDATAVRRGTILGALTLYLDFINLFLVFLRLGSNRD